MGTWADVAPRLQPPDGERARRLARHGSQGVVVGPKAGARSQWKPTQEAAARGRRVPLQKSTDEGDALMTHSVVPVISKLRCQPLMECYDERRVLRGVLNLCAIREDGVLHIDVPSACFQRG